MTTTPAEVGSRPAWLSKVLDGAWWALGAGLMGLALHKLLPSSNEPTVVVLDSRKARGEDDEDDDEDDED